MRSLKYIGFGLLGIIVLLGVIFYPKYKMLQHSVHLFDEDKIVENFRSFDKVWPTRVVEKSKTPFIYPRSKAIDLPKQFKYLNENWETQQFLEDSRTTGLIIIQNDSIVFEDYYLGNTESTRNISWSMAKSFISALIGIAVDEGDIDNVMQDVDEYVPMLKGSGYEGVTIKDVLQMSTGVAFNEDYGDFNSDINKWGRGFALGESQDEFATTLKREKAPGTFNHYVSINTHVLGMVLTRATGKSIADYMKEKLVEPLGMEYDAYWLIDGEGMEMALGGLNVALRDYAKIGSLFLHQGNWRGQQIVPEEWVRVSTTPDAPHLKPGNNPNSTSDLGYGYQWWIPEGDQGEFMALGVYNQNIYINPSTQTVIAKLSANHRFNDKSFYPSRTEMALELYRVIAHELNPEVGMKDELVVVQ